MPDFKFNCPHCKQSLEAPEEMLGQVTDCPACGKALHIPEPVRPTRAASRPPPILSKEDTKSCPFCGENILSKAKKCKHCGEFLVEGLRKGSKEQVSQTSYNPIHQIQAFIRWFTGLSQLNGFRVSNLFSGAFKRRTRSEVEACFGCGGPYATPKLDEVSGEWTYPWFFWRLLVFGLLVLVGFQFGLNQFRNIKLLPGLIIVGAFFVPLACGVLFFEYNTLRNISLYHAIKSTIAGGILSMLAALFLFDFTGLADTFLGAMSAGIVEETAKLIVAVFLLRGQKDKRWILSGMVTGAAVGVGFAGFETAGYIFEAFINGGSMGETLFVRAVFAPFGHVVWTAVTVGGLWRVKQAHPFNIEMLFDSRFLRVFGFVVLLHMFWNSGMLWTMHGVSLAYGWCISLLGSWYLALLLIQEGLNQIKTEKLAQGQKQQ